MEPPMSQTALLELVLRHQRSYAWIARFVGVSADEVEQLARVALIDLAGDAGGLLDAEQRARIAACLLGQEAPAERSATMAEIRSSEAARAWTVAALEVLIPCTEPAGDREAHAAGSLSGELGAAQDFGAGARILHERIAAAADSAGEPSWERLIAPSRLAGRPAGRWRRALGLARG